MDTTFFPHILGSLFNLHMWMKLLVKKLFVRKETSETSETGKVIITKKSTDNE